MTSTKPIDDERVRYILVGGMNANLRAYIEQYGKEQYARGVNDAWPAGRGSGEPVAWIQPDHLRKARVAPFLCRVEPTKRCSDFVPIYTSPQSREPLTDQQIWDAVEHGQIGPTMPSKAIAVARAIERAHGIRSKS